MRRVIYYLVLVFLFSSIDSTAQNFEGIIIFERKTYSNKIAIETYYFGQNKLRIDSRFFLNGEVKDYVSVFDFAKNTNLYYSGETGKLKETIIEKSLIDTFSLSQDTSKVILDRNTVRMNVNFQTLNEYGTRISQKRHLAKDLFFQIPKEWILEYIMVSNIDNRIVLRVDEKIGSDQILSKGYIRKAKVIIETSLPESLFDVNLINEPCSSLYKK